MKEYQPVKEGKVREIYDLGDSLLLVATDRVSVFDIILKTPIDRKGVVLTQMSKFWFDFTSGVIPNHMIGADAADMPEYFRGGRFAGRCMLCKKLKMIPVECIVRGYITGSGWASYQKTGKVCGITLPGGLKESDRLPVPVFTPSTKAQIGVHDENIDFERCAEAIEPGFPGRGEEYARAIRDASLELYKKCADYALGRGIIIADTKFEFGADESGRVVLADEMLTPDSSRFWPLDGYEPGKPQPSFDKQFVRDWYRANPGNDGTVPADVVEKTIGKYMEAYRLLTGRTL